MGLFSAFSRRLYLRIWIAVTVAVALLTFAVGWIWRTNVDPPPMREIILRNEEGDILPGLVAAVAARRAEFAALGFDVGRIRGWINI